MNSVTWLARLAAEAMVKNKKSGSIIQLGSIYGVVGQDLTVYEGTDMNENMTYSAIKGGITNFTRLMASYYGQFNIRVNTLCPGGLEGHVAEKSETQNPVFIGGTVMIQEPFDENKYGFNMGQKDKFFHSIIIFFLTVPSS